MKSYLVLFSFFLGLFFFGCKPEVETGNQTKPNIIWLVAEDQSPQFFPMYGDSTINLPNLEALSKDGVVFTNAYAPVPVCAPARSAIITGMYPTTLGTHNMRTYAPWKDGGNEPSIDIPSYSPIVPQGVKMFTEYLRKAGYYCTNGPKEDYNFRKLESAWDHSSKDAHFRNRLEGTPFFSVFNFSVCHESQVWARGEDKLLVSPDSVTVPPYFPDNETIRHDLAVNYSNLKRLDEQIGKIIDQLKEDGLYEKSIIFFYADHGGPFPRHKRALYETGTKVPMVIKFADREGAGEKDDRFISFIDLAPTVLSLAGVEPPKVMQGIAQFGEFEVPKKPRYVFSTSDRFDEVYDRLRAVRSKRFKYIRNFNPEISNALPVSYREQMPMMQNLRKLHEEDRLDSLQSLWFKIPKPEEELYDLVNDPYELTNLVQEEKYRDTLLHLRKVLKDWIKETNDLGRYPEKELIAEWLFSGEQPLLSPPEIQEKENEVVLSSRIVDATLLWKKPKDSLWRLYKEPLLQSQSFQAKAVRIGYQDSQVLNYGTD